MTVGASTVPGHLLRKVQGRCPLGVRRIRVRVVLQQPGNVSTACVPRSVVIQVHMGENNDHATEPSKQQTGASSTIFHLNILKPAQYQQVPGISSQALPPLHPHAPRSSPASSTSPSFTAKCNGVSPSSTKATGGDVADGGGEVKIHFQHADGGLREFP